MVAFSYQLIDAIARHHAFPDSFSIPTPAIVASLRTGDLVKIGIEFSATENNMDGERFWVKVIEATPDGYIGMVDNRLVYTAEHGIDHGQTLHFERRNVLDVIPVAV